MAKKQKVRSFIKWHAPEIIAVSSVVVGAALGATWMSIRMSNPMPHKVVVRSDSKDFIEALKAYVNWNGGKRFDSCHVGFGLTDSEVREFINGRLDEKTEDYLYGVMIEKFKK